MGNPTPTGRRTVLLGALLAGGLLGGVDLPPAAAAGGPAVQVVRLSIRLPRRLPDSAAEPVLGSIALEAWLFRDTPFWEFDPSTDPLRVSVGGVLLLDGPPFAGPKRSGNRFFAEFRLAQRGGFSPRSLVRARLDPLTGRLRLRARAVDVSPFLAGGSGPVEVRVELGEGTARDPVTMHAVGAMRLVFPPPPGSPILAVPIPAPVAPPTAPAPAPLTWAEFPPMPYGLSPGGARALVFRDTASWNTYWTSRVGAAGGVAVPAVDFTKDMVVIVGAAGRNWSDPWMGGSSHNYYIKIRSVKETGAGLQDLAIAFDLYDWFPSPIPGSVMPGDLYYAFKVLRVSKRTGTVALSETYIPTANPPPL